MDNKSKWNGKCPECSSPCYNGLIKIECSNKACKFYKKPEEGETEPIPSPNQWEAGCDMDIPTDKIVSPPPIPSPSPGYYNPFYNPGYQSPPPDGGCDTPPIDQSNDLGPKSKYKTYFLDVEMDKEKIEEIFGKFGFLCSEFVRYGYLFDEKTELWHDIMTDAIVYPEPLKPEKSLISTSGITSLCGKNCLTKNEMMEILKNGYIGNIWGGCLPDKKE